MNKLVAMFSGQGSQYVGMAQKLYEEHIEVQQLFQEAKEVLGFDLYHLCCNGPEAELQKTENTQPAILAASVAAFLVYKKEGGRTPEYGAGHSLGEITALCCAGVISFKDAISLVQNRGKLMREAVPEGVGTMAAIRGLTNISIEQTCEKVSKDNHMVTVSNYNAPSQTVISGHSKAVQEAGELLNAMGGVVIPLKVSAPFHSPLMLSCAEKMKDVLQQIEYHDFEFPVISNVTAKPYISKNDVADSLYKQIICPVLWQDTMRYLHVQGVDVAIEFGPRKVLKDLAPQNIPSMKSFSYDNEQATIHNMMMSWGKSDSDQWLKVLTKCLASAVTTKNSNWDEEEYKVGVLQPYQELVHLNARAKENQYGMGNEDIQKGLGYLRQILNTKKVPEMEQQIIMDEVASFNLI